MILEFSMFPVDQGEHLHEHVARSLDIIDKSGLPYKFGPMSTCIEGEWEQIFGVVKECFDSMSRNSGRVTATIKLDWKKGKSGQIGYKTDVIEKTLKRELEK